MLLKRLVISSGFAKVASVLIMFVVMIAVVKTFPELISFVTMTNVVIGSVFLVIGIYLGASITKESELKRNFPKRKKGFKSNPIVMPNRETRPQTSNPNQPRFNQ